MSKYWQNSMFWLVSLSLLLLTIDTKWQSLCPELPSPWQPRSSHERKSCKHRSISMKPYHTRRQQEEEKAEILLTLLTVVLTAWSVSLESVLNVQFVVLWFPIQVKGADWSLSWSTCSDISSCIDDTLYLLYFVVCHWGRFLLLSLFRLSLHENWSLGDLCLWRHSRDKGGQEIDNKRKEWITKLLSCLSEGDSGEKRRRRRKSGDGQEVIKTVESSDAYFASGQTSTGDSKTRTRK